MTVMAVNSRTICALPDPDWSTPGSDGALACKTLNNPRVTPEELTIRPCSHLADLLSKLGTFGVIRSVSAAQEQRSGLCRDIAHSGRGWQGLADHDEGTGGSTHAYSWILYTAIAAAYCVQYKPCACRARTIPPCFRVYAPIVMGP